MGSLYAAMPISLDSRAPHSQLLPLSLICYSVKSLQQPAVDQPVQATVFRQPLAPLTDDSDEACAQTELFRWSTSTPHDSLATIPLRLARVAQQHSRRRAEGPADTQSHEPFPKIMLRLHLPEHKG